MFRRRTPDLAATSPVNYTHAEDARLANYFAGLDAARERVLAKRQEREDAKKTVISVALKGPDRQSRQKAKHLLALLVADGAL